MSSDEIEDEAPPPRPPRSGAPIALALLLVLVAGGLGYWWVSGQIAAPKLAQTPPSEPPPVAAPGTPDPAPAPTPILPLGDGDALLRRLATEGSASPALLAWLGVDGILRRITAAIWLVAKGDSPRPVLGFVELAGDFAVEETTKSGSIYWVSSRGYRRYDGLISALLSIDGEYLGQAYGQLRPYFDSAFAEVATSGERFDGVLKKALVRVLEVPILEGRVELVEEGALYRFVDPALEARPPVEKQLLRMGPENLKRLQGQLRHFAKSAGIALSAP